MPWVPWTTLVHPICSEVVVLPSKAQDTHRASSKHLFLTLEASHSTLRQQAVINHLLWARPVLEASMPSLASLNQAITAPLHLISLSVSLKHKYINNLFCLFMSLFPAVSEARGPAHTCLVLSLR